MNRAKQWLIDVGLWAAPSVTEWSWAPYHFRLRFWHTPTNRTHRTYRAVISKLIAQHHQDLQSAYHQGAKDGVLQYHEYLLQEEEDIPPEQLYVN